MIRCILLWSSTATNLWECIYCSVSITIFLTSDFNIVRNQNYVWWGHQNLYDKELSCRARHGDVEWYLITLWQPDTGLIKLTLMGAAPVTSWQELVLENMENPGYRDAQEVVGRCLEIGWCFFSPFCLGSVERSSAGHSSMASLTYQIFLPQYLTPESLLITEHT